MRARPPSGDRGGVLREPVAAVSVGWAAGRALLDVCYEEDRDAEMTGGACNCQRSAILLGGTAEQMADH